MEWEGRWCWACFPPFPSLRSSRWAHSRRLPFWWVGGGHFWWGSSVPFPPPSLPHYIPVYISRALLQLFSGSVNLVNTAWESEQNCSTANMSSIRVSGGRHRQMGSCNPFYSSSIITVLWRLRQRALVVSLDFITPKLQEFESIFLRYWWSAITTRWRGRVRIFQPPCGKSYIRGQKSSLSQKEKRKSMTPSTQMEEGCGLGPYDIHELVDTSPQRALGRVTTVKCR